MKKAILMINTDPQIEGLVRKIEGIQKSADERMKFIKKQFEDMLERIEKERTPLWDEMKDLLSQKGLIPNKEAHISFDTEANLIYHVTEDEVNIHKLIGMLIKD